MITALGLALGLVINPFHRPGQLATRVHHLRPWTLVVSRDTFTDAVTCSLSGRRMRYRPGALIFHLGDGLETTHAVFRADDGAPTPVSRAFHQLEAKGYFPRRGWIDRVTGGDVALPPEMLAGASRLWIRASPRRAPAVFDIGDFVDVLDRAEDLGCPDNGFVDPKT